MCCSESLKLSLGEKGQECSGLQQQLAASNTARESAETSLKNERAISQKLHQEHDELQATCEAFKGEVNSLLADLQEHTSTIKTLEEERDALRSQVPIVDMGCGTDSVSGEEDGYNNQVLIEGIVDTTAHSCVVEPIPVSLPVL